MKRSAINCENCGKLLGERRGDTFATEVFEVDFKRSHDLICECGAKTSFLVNRRIARDGVKIAVAHER